MSARVDYIFNEQMKGDTSFQDRESLFSLMFGGTKYSKQDMRETWNLGIKHGIEIGLHKASLEGQIVELHRNTTNKKQQEFLDKLYKLCEEYKCAIQHHPEVGMVVVSKEIEF